MSKNSLGTKKNLSVAGNNYEIFDISEIHGAADLPFSLKVLLENLLRTEDGANITVDHIQKTFREFSDDRRRRVEAIKDINFLASQLKLRNTMSPVKAAENIQKQIKFHIK